MGSLLLRRQMYCDHEPKLRCESSTLSWGRGQGEGGLFSFGSRREFPNRLAHWTLEPTYEEPSPAALLLLAQNFAQAPTTERSEPN